MPTPHYIPGFIVEYPRRVEFKAQSDLSDCRVPFTATSWAAFVADNEFDRDEADAAAMLAAHFAGSDFAPTGARDSTWEVPRATGYYSGPGRRYDLDMCWVPKGFTGGEE